MMVAAFLIDDESGSIDIQKQRTAFFRSKIIDKSRDDNVNLIPSDVIELPVTDYDNYGGMEELALPVSRANSSTGGPSTNPINSAA
jgi:hypothetical protein